MRKVEIARACPLTPAAPAASESRPEASQVAQAELSPSWPVRSPLLDPPSLEESVNSQNAADPKPIDNEADREQKQQRGSSADNESNRSARLHGEIKAEPAEDGSQSEEEEGENGEDDDEDTGPVTNGSSNNKDTYMAYTWKPGKCHVCEKSVFSLRDHMLVHTKEKPHECPQCGKRFSKRGNRARHVMSTHFGVKQKRKKKTKTPQLQPRGTLSSALLSSSFSFSSSSSRFFFSVVLLLLLLVLLLMLRQLKQAVLGQQAAVKPRNTAPIKRGNKYLCPFCKQTFIDKTKCCGHIRSHTGEKPFPCAHCDETFSMKGNLTRHLRVHSVKKPSSKGVKDRSSLNKKLRAKPYSCTFCKKSFAECDTLQKHVLIHTSLFQHEF